MATTSAAPLERMVEQFTLLSDPARLKILLMLLQTGELCVSDLTSKLRMSMPAVSHHLRLLREAGVVNCQRRGQMKCYSLTETTEGKRMQKILKTSNAV